MTETRRLSQPNDRVNSSKRVSFVDIPVAPLAPNPMSGTPSRRRPTCTLSVVIAGVSVVNVMVIAITTFCITYLTSRETIDEVGRAYCQSIVSSSRREMETLFDTASGAANSLSVLHRRSGIVLPSDDPNKWEVLTMTTNAILILRIMHPELTSFLVWYDDGSAITLLQANFGRNLMLVSRNSGFLNTTTKCCLENRQLELFENNMTTPTVPLYPSIPVMQDTRVFWEETRATYVNSERGAWADLTLSEDLALNVRMFYLSVFAPIRNASEFLGMTFISLSSASLTKALASVPRTPHAHTFVFDSHPAIVATTHPADFSTYSKTTDRTYVPFPNCANSGVYAASEVVNFTIGCRATPQQYPFEPLRAIDRKYPHITRLSAGEQVILNVDTASSHGRYYTAGVGLENFESGFKFTLLLLMPEDDILGDIARSRNIAIGVIVIVAVIAALAAVAISTVILRPIRLICTHMRRTTNLRESMTIADGEMSRLAELYDLEDAYQNMDMAIRSFTRYVPRDVVKDLLATGELCAIRMQPKNCTMMFTDIQGFTTMCERVAPSELSDLVRSYFEVMSSIVMGHEGLIDKFIGDCIMVVWGAPFAVPNAEVKAALCGLRMIRETKVPPLAAQFDSAGEQLHVRVGLASGTVLAGNMGSSERMNYTVIGDAVNLAARLESLNKQFGTSMMMSDAVQRKVSGVFTSRLLLTIRVVGKEEAVKVYEPIGVRGFLDPQVAASLQCEETNRLNQPESMMMDSMSTLSDTTRPISGATPDARHKDVLQLIDETARFTQYPLTATVDEDVLAAVHTQAAKQFMARDFAGALSSLGGMALHALPPTSALTNRTPIKKLEALCHDYLRNPPGPEFDGVWMSQEK
jgi:class 3 adenylate cyclase